MQINWTVITCFVVAFFAWSGYARGWWKEGITTAFLAGLILLLQQPNWAQTLINWLNGLLATIWDIIPDSITALISDALETFFGISTAGGPIQTTASDSSTWIIILISVVAISTLIGRFAFKNPPTLLGGLIGTVIGGLNGFLVLSLVREYLDGRALPGRTAPPSEITLAGASAFGPASPTVSIQLANLPSTTILDSAIPWILIVFGVLLTISVLRTRVALETKNGAYRINFNRVPPLYSATLKPKKPRTVDDILDALPRTTTQ